jgi:hypothetical protein
MYKFKGKNKNMLTTLGRKIGQQSKQVSRKIGKQSKRISRKISKRLNKTIRNDSNKVRQFYKKMFKKFKGGCSGCPIIGGKPIKGG